MEAASFLFVHVKNNDYLCIKHNLLIMRKALILLLVFACSLAEAHNDKFLNVDFGTSRNEALQQIEQHFGNPNATDGDNLIYYDLDINGYRFSKIIFGFEPKQSGGYFNEARFFIEKDTRRHAVAVRDSLAKQLGRRYGITYDYEENGNKFYTGGVAPGGIGHLFTISTHRRNGKWTTELRYGAFHKLKKRQ